MAHMAAALASLVLTLEGSNKTLAESLKSFLILAIIGGIAVVLSLFVGISPCIFYHITGLPCPACGLTRAFISLARFDLWQAFVYHPLFILVPFIPLLYLERISNKLRNILAYSALALLLVVWVIRMVVLFPDVEPMTYNENSLFEFVRRLFTFVFYQK